MFTRIVKMEFEDAKISEFLSNFDELKSKIRNFSGCTFLVPIIIGMYRDKNNTAIFFTYSRWEDEKDLDAYRTSELFKSIWATTKPMFRSKAQAWSVDTLVHAP